MKDKYYQTTLFWPYGHRPTILMTSHIFKYYHDDIIFQDSIQRIDGTMTLMFNKFPSTPIYGTTKLTIRDDGQIIQQRGQYDLLGIS